MQLIGAAGGNSLFGTEGNDEGLISSAGEDVLYFGDDCNSLYAGGYGQRDESYCGGGRD